MLFALSRVSYTFPSHYAVTTVKPLFVRVPSGILLSLLTLVSACGPRDLVLVDPAPKSSGADIPAAFLNGLVGLDRKQRFAGLDGLARVLEPRDKTGFVH